MPSKIEWTEETWNPVTGCTKVSPGCAHCYAERITQRFGRDFSEVVLHPERLVAPRRRKKPTMYFVNSMSDLFHEEIPFEFVAHVFYTMATTPHHTYQVLTKRPERAVEFTNSGHIKAAWWGGRTFRRWPPNVWMGVSVENQRYTDRIHHLLKIPAKVRFLSCEPLLGPLDIDNYLAFPNEGPDEETPVHWVIAGGESGPGARPANLDWFRELRDQCAETHTPYFLKQLGGRQDKRGGDKALLDGRLWREMPAVSQA